VIALALVACGRLRFDPIAAGDGGGDALVIDGVADRPNVAFVTAAQYPASLGGLAMADSICQSDAVAAQLPGTFVALVSTSSGAARDRLAGSRGWVRSDDTPIADLPSDLFVNGRMFNPIDHDATGVRVAAVSTRVWTGSDINGRLELNYGACGDWTASTGMAIVGFFDRSGPYEVYTTPELCSDSAHLYCFEVGHAYPVQPIVTSGRIAFVGSNTGNVGSNGLDAQCQMDATNAGLSGSYIAAVALTNSSVASRFSGTAPWRRVDGTQVSASGAAMFDGTDLLSFVNQTADGTYLASQFTAITKTGVAVDATTAGTNTSTCGDWAVATGPGGVGGTPIETAQSAFWSATTVACNVMAAELCLQQ